MATVAVDPLNVFEAVEVVMVDAADVDAVDVFFPWTRA
jgi:hypothetical protein